MELTKVEITVVEQLAEMAHEAKLLELSELQLVLVGGGIGETVL